MCMHIFRCARDCRGTKYRAQRRLVVAARAHFIQFRVYNTFCCGWSWLVGLFAYEVYVYVCARAFELGEVCCLRLYHQAMWKPFNIPQ